MRIRLVFAASQPTALQTVLAAETAKEAKIKSLLAFYMVALLVYLEKLPAAKARKLASSLFSAAGSPSVAKPTMKMLELGNVEDLGDFEFPYKIEDPELRKLGRAIVNCEEVGDKYYQEVGRLAHLITDPSVVNLWKPALVKPTAKTHKDPQERKKALNRYLKDVLIGLLRDKTEFPAILKKLEAESGSSFVRGVPKPLMKHLNVLETGQLTYDGEPLVSRANSPTTIWLLRDSKLSLPVREKEGGYVFQYKPGFGDTLQKVYKQSDVQQANQKKWKIVDKLISRLPTIKAGWQKLLKKDVPLGAILQFAYITSARIGTVGNTTFGISTLQARHFTWKGKSLIVKYPGKGQAGKAVEQEHRIEPNAETRDLLRYIKKRLSVVAKNQIVFSDDGEPVSNGEINGWLGRYIPGLTVHKFRHLRGTSLALEVLGKLKVPAKIKQSDAQRLFKTAIERVSKALGHYNIRGDEVKISTGTAIKSYIDPNVGIEWFRNLGLQIPKFLPKP